MLKHIGTMMEIEQVGFDADDETHVGFLQSAIDDGSIWNLQGWWGRLAHHAIDAGVCLAPEEAV